MNFIELSSKSQAQFIRALIIRIIHENEVIANDLYIKNRGKFPFLNKTSVHSLEK